jgi:signal transduction histidine kinase
MTGGMRSRVRGRSERFLARPVLVLVGSLVLAILATLLSWRYEESRRHAAIDAAVTAEMSRLDAQVAGHLALLRATRAFVKVEGAGLTTERFGQFVSGLRVREQYPGIQGIGWSPRVSGDGEFRVLFLEPADARNRAALGFNMHSEPVRAEAMDRARDSGTFAFSGAVILKQEIDPEKNPGFLVYTPAYAGDGIADSIEARRERLTGFVYAAFRANDFFSTALPGTEGVRVVSIVSSASGRTARLFGPDGAGTEPGVDRTLDVGGQVWHLHFELVDPALRTRPNLVPLVILAGGLAISILLFELARTQHKRRSRAEARASAMARQVEFSELLIGIVSHDLRNPLNVIHLNAALLERSGLKDELLRCVKRIESSTALSMRLIRDLLDFTRARLGGGIGIVRAPGDIVAVVQQVVDQARLEHPQRPIELHVDGDGTGTWDADRISQVISNLLANAIVYGSADSPVDVRVDCTGADVLLHVSNGGAPIPADVLPTLFEPFRQHDAAAGASRRNIGLGLYIVREIVKAHGGTISVASTAGQGTTFTMRLPRTS